MKQVTFEKINTKSALFAELKSGKYPWWDKVKRDPNLYIDVRKDNNINVYYEGGSVIKLHYCSKHKKIQAKTHVKYLYGKGKGYVECADMLNEKIDSIIERIPVFYSQKKGGDKELWSETYIKGHIITKRPNHLDSEFAYTDDGINLQIDLVECVNGMLRFVELKRIGDNRMLNKDETSPEVIDQINKYRKFIEKNKTELVRYYQTIWDIKHDLLDLPNLPLRPIDINPEPLLLIFNNWTKVSSRRSDRMERIKNHLKNANIDYVIESEI